MLKDLEIPWHLVKTLKRFWNVQRDERDIVSRGSFKTDLRLAIHILDGQQQLDIESKPGLYQLIIQFKAYFTDKENEAPKG